MKGKGKGSKNGNSGQSILQIRFDDKGAQGNNKGITTSVTTSKDMTLVVVTYLTASSAKTIFVVCFFRVVIAFL